MENGYIKIHRKIRESWIYKKSTYYHLFSELLLSAGYEKKELLWDGGVIKLIPGQFITSRDKLSKITGINSSSVHKMLKMLEKEQMIEQQTFTKFRIITIVNWDKYQVNEEKSNTKSNNRVTTEEQQNNTNKKDKKDKNIKKERENTFSPPSLQDVSSYCLLRNNAVSPQGFIDFYESKGWFVGKNKMKDWRAAVRTWENRDTNKGRSNEEIEIPEYAKKYIK